MRREKVEKAKLNAIDTEDNCKKMKKKNCLQIIFPRLICVLILDFSALSYIDPSGVAAVLSICEQFNKIDIPIYISGCSGTAGVLRPQNL